MASVQVELLHVRSAIDTHEALRFELVRTSCVSAFARSKRPIFGSPNDDHKCLIIELNHSKIKVLTHKTVKHVNIRLNLIWFTRCEGEGGMANH